VVVNGTGRVGAAFGQVRMNLSGASIGQVGTGVADGKDNGLS